MNIRIAGLALFFYLFTPYASHAAVLFSEIAWMGTDASADNEWIEIYNFSNTPTNLSGWTIEGALSIALSGTLPPHGVVLLERTNDDTVPGITALLTYTGALANGGGTLIIKDSQGAVSDEAVGGDSWAGIGGSNILPKKTAQRTRMGAWVTAGPTPGAENAEVSEEVEEEITATTTEETHTSTSNTVRKSGGGGSSSKKKTEDVYETTGILSLGIEGPKTVYVNQEVSFEVTPDGLGKTVMNSLLYTWNFGDTYTGSSKKPSHVFRFPGEYIVVVEGSFGKYTAMAKQEIQVLPVVFAIERTQAGDVVVTNGADYEIDLGGFSIEGSNFVFPRYTFLKAKASLVVPREKVGASPHLALKDAEGIVVSALQPPPSSFTQRVVPTQTASLPSSTVSEDLILVPEMEEETIIRIGETDSNTEAGMFARFWTTFAKMFGS